MNTRNESGSNRFRMVLSLIIANAIRLLKVIPNNDPIMSMALPFSRRSSALTSFLFPLLTMVSFDVVTGYVGSWTAVTAVTYGLIGLAFHYFLKDRERVRIWNYLGCGIVGVLVYDFITGVVATPFMFPDMTFMQALVGQVPFTLMHLATTSAFILIVTPLLDKQVLVNESFADNRVIAFLSRLSPAAS